MIKKVAYIILILFAMSLFGAAVRHVVLGGQRLGFATQIIDKMSYLPYLFKPSLQKINKLPSQFQNTLSSLKAVNKLDNDVLVLFSSLKDRTSRQIHLKNLKTDSVLYTWDVDCDFREDQRLLHPLLLDEKRVAFNVTNDAIYIIDSLGEVLNKIGGDDFVTHHCLNKDSEGNFCTLGKETDQGKEIYTHRYSSSSLKQNQGYFKDEFILKVDSSGKEIFKKSLYEILKENDLESYLRKAHYNLGPFHSNDVEPCNVSGSFFKKGDIFVSIRNMSIILLYRPATNKVLKVIEGNFSFQHDVDIINDSIVTFFSNNSINKMTYKNAESKVSNTLNGVDMGPSEIYRYNFASDSLQVINLFTSKESEIFTFYEGLHHWLSNGDLFIEEQETGLLWIVNDSIIKYKNVLPSQHEGYHHMLNWTRVIE